MMNFELREKIGHGGMGQVFKAFDPSLDRYVAIKFMEEALAHDRVCSERFLREARNLAKIDHPNVVRVIYAGANEKGLPYFVMELLEGIPLSERIRRGPMQTDEIADIMSQALSGLGAAHKLNITHRDIKSSNILLCADGRVKIIDFGIARDDELSSVTSAGNILGTPAYMSPEQANGLRAGPTSDLYSMGIVLYEMLSGSVPFRADTPIAVLRMQVDFPPPELPKSLPEPFRRTTVRALQKDPKRRFSTADDMLASLRTKVPKTSGQGATVFDSENKQRNNTRTGLVVCGLLVPMIVVGIALNMNSIGPAGESTKVSNDEARKEASAGNRFSADDLIGETPSTANPPKPEKQKQEPPPGVDKTAAREILNSWLAAQNGSQFGDYAELYHPDFRGTKRTKNGRTTTYTRSTWLADRKKMYTNGTYPTVSAQDVNIRIVMGTAIIEFMQYFNGKKYSDYGPKTLKIVNLAGRPKIIKEELLWSKTL